jgi:hypothetical protein
LGGGDDISGVEFLHQFSLGVPGHSQRGAGFVEPVDFAIEVVATEADAEEEEGDGANLQPAGEQPSRYLRSSAAGLGFNFCLTTLIELQHKG